MAHVRYFIRVLLFVFSIGCSDDTGQGQDVGSKDQRTVDQGTGDAPTQDKSAGDSVWWCDTKIKIDQALTADQNQGELGADSAPVSDSKVPDSKTAADGSKLWPCTHPGKPCNAHDPCAINPICGNDKLCHPSSYQNCSDGLSCTVDQCVGLGLCSNTPKSGTCALPVKSGSTTVLKCFIKGDKQPTNPCFICDPSKSQNTWTKIC